MPWTLMEAAWWVGRKHDRTNYLNLYLPPDQCTIPLDRGGYCGPVFVLRPFHRTFYATLEYNTRATPLAGPTGRPCPPRLGNRLGTRRAIMSRVYSGQDRPPTSFTYIRRCICPL